MRIWLPEAAPLNPAWTFTVRDLAAGLWGTLVFALPMLAPGYLLLGWLHRGEPSHGLREQLAWSIALSLSAGTLLQVALVWWFGVIATGYVLVALAVVAAALFLRRRPPVHLHRREVVLGLTLLLGLIAFVFLSLVDIGYGPHLWMSVTVYDHSVRTAFVSAVMRTGVPPANPLYWPGQAAPLRYYYFWYVSCAVVARVAHISARQALIASCVWPPIGIVAMLALYGRHLLGWTGAVLRRNLTLAIALLSVTGLDLLCILGARLGGEPLPGDMEWWSITPVASWADTFLWVPHHVAALVACLLTLLLLSMAAHQADAHRHRLAILAGVSFAASFGLSTYLAAATALVIAAWLLWSLFHHDRLRLWRNSAVAAAVALALLAPYLAQLLHRAPGARASGAVFAPGIRSMIAPDPLLTLPLLRAVRAAHPFATTQIAALLLLVPGYIAEFGFFAAVLALALYSRRHRPRSAAESTLLVWSIAGLFAATFVRSQVIATNDFGIRAALLPQFFLLLLAVPVLQQSHRWLRSALLGLAIVGVAGTLYQGTMLRLYLPWHELHADPAVTDLSERNAALADAFAAFDARIPGNARLQYAIAPGYAGFASMIHADHQLIVGDAGCDSSFGGDPAVCPAIQQTIAQLYLEHLPSPAGREAAALCSHLGAQYLVATRWDAVWNSPQGWVWTLPGVIARPSVRIVACHSGTF